MPARTVTAVDNTQAGCPLPDDGLHAIAWMNVPAQVWVGQPDRGYGSHKRGVCLDCGEIFID